MTKKTTEIKGKFKPGQSGNPAGRAKGSKNPRTALQDSLNKVSHDAVLKCAAEGHLTAYEFLSRAIQEDGGIPVAVVSVDNPTTVEIKHMRTAQQMKIQAANKLIVYQNRAQPTMIEVDDNTTMVAAHATLALNKLVDFLGAGEDETDEEKKDE